MIRLCAIWTFLVLVTASGAAAQGMNDVLEILDEKGTVLLEGTDVILTRADFALGADSVEAIAFRPSAAGVYPGIFIIPGFSRSARDYVPFGVRFAAQGFSCLAVSMPGFGRSSGNPDFCGPKTTAALEAALRRFRALGYVDSTRIGAYGYSRGAISAAMLATRNDGLRAAIFASGIYDLARAYGEIKDQGILLNLKNETGLADAALRERSPLFDMERLACPVLILHGEKDQNAPVDQAKLLEARLTDLKKPFEIKLYPEAGHDLGMANVLEATGDFFTRTLKAKTH
jgi:dipeptidyl aminopeptidase/acylaminoacyl peptidase